MNVLLDTHTWAWMLADDPQLSATARHSLENAETIRLSPISFFEISQKVRLGKLPSIAPYMDSLTTLMEEQGIMTALFTPDIARLAGSIAWDHRDPFDRILAATAILSGSTLVSADTMFDTLDDARLRRIW